MEAQRGLGAKLKRYHPSATFYKQGGVEFTLLYTAHFVPHAGNRQNPARQVALRAGIPDTVSALTVNKVCGSGLQSVMLASQAIRLGELEVAVAGGMESMTNAPYLLKKARLGYRLGNGE